MQGVPTAAAAVAVVQKLYEEVAMLRDKQPSTAHQLTHHYQISNSVVRPCNDKPTPVDDNNDLIQVWGSIKAVLQL